MFPQFYGTTQAAATLSAPTGVSTATATVPAPGEYDNACILIASVFGTMGDGSEFTDGRATINLTASEWSVTQSIRLFAFMMDRGGTATTFTWVLEMNSFNWAFGPPTIVGIAATTQDCTDTSGAGVGQNVSINSAASINDEINLTLTGTASNEAGSTIARAVSIQLVWG